MKREGAQGAQDMYESKPRYYYEQVNPHIVNKVRPDASVVLDVGCATGALGAVIRGRGKSVYGIELFPPAAKEAEEKLDHVLCGDIETIDLPYQHDFFDHIIFGDVLEHLRDPWAVLRKVKPYLKKTGSIIACIPNVGHISIILGLIQGNWTYTHAGLLDETHLRFFTLNEIIKLFQSTGYQLQTIDRLPLSNPMFDLMIDQLNRFRSSFKLGNDHFLLDAKTWQYLVVATKGGD